MKNITKYVQSTYVLIPDFPDTAAWSVALLYSPL